MWHPLDLQCKPLAGHPRPRLGQSLKAQPQSACHQLSQQLAQASCCSARIHVKSRSTQERIDLTDPQPAMHVLHRQSRRWKIQTFHVNNAICKAQNSAVKAHYCCNHHLPAHIFELCPGQPAKSYSSDIDSSDVIHLHIWLDLSCPGL